MPGGSHRDDGAVTDPHPVSEPHDRGLLAVGEGNLLHWEVSGNPAGRPAVFLHGGPGSGSSPGHRRLFDPDAYRIVQFDQRGCGRSTPHAGDPGTELRHNTTWHLVADLERLREHLGIDRWLVAGGSWGTTLGLAYAQAHPDRVTALVLGGVALTRRSELAWLYGGGLARLLPEQWRAFRAGVPPWDHDADLLEAYARLLDDPDPAVRARAAADWCAWETASLESPPPPGLSPRFTDPRYALGFARLVTHYFRHAAWLAEDQLLRGIHAVADLPAVLVQGRLDLQCPLETAWELAAAWPSAELVVVDGAGHAGDHPDLTAALVAATDRFR